MRRKRFNVWAHDEKWEDGFNVSDSETGEDFMLPSDTTRTLAREAASILNRIDRENHRRKLWHDRKPRVK